MEIPWNVKLSAIRKQKGYTQTSLAKVIGLQSGSYINYEQGNRQPNFAMLKIICSTLGCTANDILGYQNQQYDSELNMLYNELPPVYQARAVGYIEGLLAEARTKGAKTNENA